VRSSTSPDRPSAGRRSTARLAAPPPTEAPSSVALRPQIASEDLGAQTIEGVLAHGRRSTATFPVGSQGNDRPFVTVYESWFSEELKMNVLVRHSDSRSGESITRLTNISLSEPEPSLFQVPADYTIREDNGF
jgi:hypothetical protein